MSGAVERAWPREVEVPAPEPELTAHEIVRRAAALKPKVREQQDESEARGYHSEELYRDFVQAGFYRMLQPRRFGGYEFDLPTFWKAMIQIAEGDPGTGWCLTLASHHAWVIGSHWPEQAQREIFGPEGDFRAPHRALPAGKVRPVEGGYVVDGTWDYCSGVPYSTHFMGNGLIESPDADTPPEICVAVVPPGQYRMLDDWGGGAQLGMQSSGSQGVTVENVVVPEHWVFRGGLNARPGATAGTALHGNPMYLGMIYGVYHAGLVLTQIGAAKAALAEFEGSITSRPTYFDPSVMRFQHHDYQRTYGLARGMAQSAETLLYGIGEKYHEFADRWATTGEAFSRDDDGLLWSMAQQAGRLAAETVELLWRNASSSSAKRGQRMQRYFRDVAMYRQHIAAQYLNLSTEFARVHFDLPANLPG